ncbi:MAG: cation diffusion facilitator family transporter [bacterium]
MAHDLPSPPRAHGDDRRRLIWTLAITLVVLVAEIAGGLLSGSLALLADAAHMASDVAALGLSLFALWFAARPATAERTFGFQRVEILAALANSASLLVIAGLIFAEAYGRLLSPPAVRSSLMLGVASVGLVANIAAALMLAPGRHRGLNLRSAFLHVLGDLLGSVGTIAAAVVIAVTGWLPADPILSALIGVLIVVSAWRLMRESVAVLLEGMPRGLRYAEVAEAMRGLPDVVDLHDLHVWSITSDFPVLTSHIVVNDAADPAQVLEALQEVLAGRFGINHATLQLEKHGHTQTWVCTGDRCYPAGV